MSLPSLLPRTLLALLPSALLLGFLLAGAPAAPAQQPPEADTLAVSNEAHRPPADVTSPTRRCRDTIDRQAGAAPVAQARCSGGFGAPAVSSGRRLERVDVGWHAWVHAAVAAALAERSD